jgi:esterase/lipase superfamily enzyme
MIADTPGVEKLHSLPTVAAPMSGDGLARARDRGLHRRELLDSRFKIQNIVLMSPDLDLDVGVAKLFSIESDPPCLRSDAESAPRLPSPKLRLTVYMSEGDKALGIVRVVDGQPAPDGTSR